MIAGHLAVITPDREAAPTVLFFGGLERSRPSSIRIAQYRRDAVASALGGASAVVFVRGLIEFADVIACATRLGIPRYYFVDDNFIVIREQGGAAARFAIDHSQHNVARMLRGFEGVLVSTAPLEADFRSRGLHEHLMRFPPVVIPRVSGVAGADAIRVAFFGGAHLHDLLRTTILPALRRLASARPVTLIAVGVDAPIGPSSQLTIERMPYASYLDGVNALARAGVNVLVHPVAPGLPSNPFKNPHALITANAIGAVPVVSDAPPYTDLRESGSVVLCADSVDGWYSGLTAAIDPHVAAPMSRRLAEYCAREFSGDVNIAVCESLLRRHRPPTPLAAGARSAAIAASLSTARVVRGLRRAMSGAPAELKS